MPRCKKEVEIVYTMLEVSRAHTYFPSNAQVIFGHKAQLYFPMPLADESVGRLWEFLVKSDYTMSG